MTKNIQRNYWIDNLRSFITVLVVAHHSSLAYTTFARFDKETYINSTAPVVNKARWVGMDIFENFNDIFFMSLMFLISGLFVFKGIQKKGSNKFLYERFKRLGIPFIIGVTVVIPFAYLPSFYIVNHHFNAWLFIKDYIIHQQWPVGPPWFIWLLLLFNIIAAFMPAAFYTKVSDAIASLAKKPFLFLLACFVIVSAALIPISLWVGQYKWTGIGPFDFQLNRIFLYFVFFLFGACMGSGDWESHLFTNNKLLNMRWQFWLFLCLAVYIIVEAVSVWGYKMVMAGTISETMGWIIFDAFFVASCIASSFAFLALFKQKINETGKVWKSLSANAFGIYLIHYVFVSWFQFALLSVSMPVFLKFLLVFSGALAVSWVIIHWARKIKVVNQII